MVLEFRKVDTDNFDEFIDLEVKPDQKDCFFFKSTKPNVMTLAQAHVWESSTVEAIYDDEIMIGSVFFGSHEEEGKIIAWLTRLMLDQKYQGKGRGRKAMEILIQRIKTENEGREIRLGLSHEPENKIAENLYTSLGFKHDGEISGGQKVVWLDIE